MADTMDSMPAPNKAESYMHARTEGLHHTPPRTPTAVTSAAHNLVGEIHDIYGALSKLSSLAPGVQVNALLTRLVSLCIIPYDEDFVTEFFNIAGTDTLCSQLRPLCAIAEGELESYWARKIISESSSTEASSKRTRALLSTFPYHQNYIDLSRIECSTLSAFLPASVESLKVAFIGSGPLPLTSLCMLDIFPSAHIHNIDRDASALSTSKSLSAGIGYADQMSFACIDVSKQDEVKGATKWDEFDVVFLAALVGMNTTSKLAVLAGLVAKMRPGALVAVRSAKGLRAVLYPILELGDDLERIGLETLVEVHPWTKVVNSVIVLRVKG